MSLNLKWMIMTIYLGNLVGLGLKNKKIYFLKIRIIREKIFDLNKNV